MIQAELPFPDGRDAEIRARYARNLRAHRAECSEENLCIAWVTKSDGRAWRDWWAALPNYQRHSYLSLYQSERGAANECGRGMRPFSVCTVPEEAIRARAESVESMRQGILDAAAHGRPMPYRESEHMTPMERLDFRSRLTSAMVAAGCVIIAPPEGENEKQRKNKKKR